MFDAVLFVVATPIGNLGDMTPRAVEVLQSVALIAAEDTRHSSRLMAHFNIKAPMISLHDHNERQRLQTILDKLAAGDSIALISDAGTPLISDPGFILVRAVREAGFKVVPVPGACAVITAMCASGVPTDKFVFEGFLPAKRVGRKQKFEALVAEERTVIFYESTHRILDSLADMRDVLGEDRYVVVARELTKTFETIHGDTLGNVIEWITADHNQQKGEFVLLVQGVELESSDGPSPEALKVLDVLLEELPVKQASALAAKITGEKKNALYQIALNRK
ncbi:16S rRNA (cytidine(1402)-2'-O)-methyltransferase [Neptunomonas phycophila]|jgi:16S rRNA (cytidine1402-2'-O)-methyltransferase|uniref:Ribosomal RNA small subunit methyltransferase I n=2 Tax=Neptunomonas phycophila TaxID=1572645 RepID=A0AAW7XNY7_9GAMM|nr:16S rRNA (cytidine(1402)-2'-O)-methyltransferase [Neptunomonas phycophila]MBT3144099.1 16S rRNA (cytidine(1402)-2'-O)-methyltransferase [Neptunomonas phycophila]MDO6454702.1 16S rRNA (cytidine(1402)-2'-O)-methyltransferase [Neptunomonas phycophila]MDO6782726.1 16S rRNA (cytidine(1402)-2'-O)-methyltransferase [Neptunomonas phycophila]